MNFEKLKDRIWILHLPLIAFFTFAFWVTNAAEDGTLTNEFIRKSFYSPLRTLTGQFTNMKFRLRGAQPPKNKVVIVEVDSQSLDMLGRWPWHRDTMALLIDRIMSLGAKTVALDIVFSEPDPRVPDELKAILDANKLNGVSDQFETDPVLGQVIDQYKDRLVLGWMTEALCQPKYDGPEVCPVTNPEFLTSLPKNFDQYAVSPFKTHQNFNAGMTPILSAPFVIANLPTYIEKSRYSGTLNTFPDPDGYVRRVPLVIMVGGKPQPSLAFASYMAGTKETASVSLDEMGRLAEIKLLPSGRTVDVNKLGALDPNFRGPGYSFPYISAVEVLREEDDVKIGEHRDLASKKSDLFKDAYVFVGISAIGVSDLRAFPFGSQIPGVEAHATVLDNLLSGDWILTHNNDNKSIWIFLLMTLGAGIFGWLTQRLDAFPALMLAIVGLGGFGLADLKLLFENGHNWNTSFLYLEVFSIFVMTVAIKYVIEEKNKKFIKGALTKYVSPAVVDSIIEDPTKLSLGGEKRDLTILFSDIRSFTSFSEKMDAKELAKFLNEYLGVMTDIVFETGGTLDKYIGDAVMAFWGAPLASPEHAYKAIQAAIKMQQVLNVERVKYKEQYGIDVNIGIGINSGAVNVGNMGSDKVFEYTVIGDHVNLASRLEGITKTYHSGIIASRFTLDFVEKAGKPLPAHRVLDFVKVKGKAKPVEILQILEREMSQEGLTAYEEARKLYEKQAWDESVARFQAANEKLRPNAEENDGPCEMYIERCQYFKENSPGADWDGTWQMTSK